MEHPGRCVPKPYARKLSSSTKHGRRDEPTPSLPPTSLAVAAAAVRSQGLIVALASAAKLLCKAAATYDEHALCDPSCFGDVRYAYANARWSGSAPALNAKTELDSGNAHISTGLHTDATTSPCRNLQSLDSDPTSAAAAKLCRRTG